MFEQINQQMKESFKPFTELATLNMNALQEVAEKQNALMSTLLNEGVSFAEKVAQQKDVMSVAETQKAYFETVQEAITESAKETYTIVSGAQQKAGALIKDYSEELSTKFKVAK